MFLTNQIIWFYLNKTKEGNNIKVTKKNNYNNLGKKHLSTHREYGRKK
jgi:hypothetical protein